MKSYQLIIIALGILANSVVGRSYDDDDSHWLELQNQQANLLEHKNTASQQLTVKLNGTENDAAIVALLSKEPKSSFFDDFERK